MKLTLVEHGGWGASLKRQPIFVDTDALPPMVAEKISRLADSAELAQGEALKEAPRQVADGMSYDVSLDRAGRVVTLSGTDSSGNQHFLELVQEIRMHAANSR